MSRGGEDERKETLLHSFPSPSYSSLSTADVGTRIALEGAGLLQHVDLEHPFCDDRELYQLYAPSEVMPVAIEATW